MELEQRVVEIVKLLDGVTFAQMTAILIRVDTLIKNGNVIKTSLN